ncbi:MAG TPA: neocarzinostatin apoprotein domain-containing protein [Acidimicrobiia bacterium]|nr:neocarzinostatin apoprotein domain-containing protein [Acidimicrobiia bacterium]
MRAHRRAAGSFAGIVALVAAITGAGVVPAGAATAKAPSITVTPHTALKPGQTVKVALTGFGHKRDVVAIECLKGTTDPAACDIGNYVEGTTDAAGALTLKLTVHRTLLGDDGFADCVKVACEVLASPGSVFSTATTASIAFDPKVPLPKTSLTTKPATKLLDEQTVKVAGSGFVLAKNPNDGVQIEECITVSLLCGTGTFVSASGSKGTFSTVLSVRREISNGLGARFDCAKKPGACELVAFDETDVDYHAIAPLAFDASVPPPPPAALVVKPSTNLPYYARVNVTGKHFNANDFLFMLECAGSDFSECAFLQTLAQSDSGGAFQATPLLQRKIPDLLDPTGPTVDCAKVKPACFLLVEDSAGDNAMANLSFDPKAPVPPPPALTVTPAAPYRDGEILHLKGTNFPPSAEYSTSECLVGPRDGVCLGTEDGSGVTTAKGALSTTFPVARRFDEDGTNLDCAKANVTCTLEVDSEGGVTTSIPLTFTSGAGAVAAPAARLRRMPARSAWLANARSRAAMARAAVPRLHLADALR